MVDHKPWFGLTLKGSKDELTTSGTRVVDLNVQIP